MSNTVIRIHNPMMALPSFNFKGIEAYSTRAMTDCGGVTIVADCGNPVSLRSTHAYLRQLGLGPEELVLVTTPENGDLYQAVSNDRDLRQKIGGLVQNAGYKIEFFCTRADIESNFIRDLGMDWLSVISHPSTLADVWNDKSQLRAIARQHQMAYAFPAHVVVHSALELHQNVRTMLQQYPEVVIKRPLWASGLGMVFGHDASIAERYCTQHNGVPTGTIVERSLGATHLSMSIVVRFQNGHVIDQWFTEQECPQRDGSVVHEGSILGDLPRVTTADTLWMERTTAPFYDLILNAHPHLTGIVNFDCLRAHEERFVLECNARVTFSTYVQNIRRALLAKRGIADWHREPDASCLVRKVVPRSARDFESLASALGATLLVNSNQSGVIPIVLGCLTTSGYCYLVAIADSYQETLEVMTEAKLKVEA